MSKFTRRSLFKTLFQASAALGAGSKVPARAALATVRPNYLTPLVSFDACDAAERLGMRVAFRMDQLAREAFDNAGA